MHIKTLQLKGDKEGDLSLSGHISIDGWKPTALNITLNGKNVLIPHKPAAFARIHPTLSLSGTFEAPVLAGNITVAEGRLNIDLLSDQSPAEIQIDAAAPGQPLDIGLSQTKSGAAEWLTPLVADLIVDIPKNAWVKGQNLNAEIGGQINIKKTSAGPFILVGPLNILKGNFMFQNRLFKVTQGLVDFAGMAEPDPNLDIKAKLKSKKSK